jgi:hypothetical protein
MRERVVASGAELSAQGWFRLMVRSRLAPGLRGYGFIGSGHTFRSSIDGYYAQVTLQQVAAASTSYVRFTADLSVVRRNEWDEQLRVRPYYGSRPQPSAPGWSARIGELISVGGFPIGEMWWELDAGRPFESLADEVVSAVRWYALPAMMEQIASARRGH